MSDVETGDASKGKRSSCRLFFFLFLSLHPSWFSQVAIPGTFGAHYESFVPTYHPIDFGTATPQDEKQHCHRHNDFYNSIVCLYVGGDNTSVLILVDDAQAKN